MVNDDSYILLTGSESDAVAIKLKYHAYLTTFKHRDNMIQTVNALGQSLALLDEAHRQAARV